MGDIPASPGDPGSPSKPGGPNIYILNLQLLVSQQKNSC